jgi:hypothetical protein
MMRDQFVKECLFLKIIPEVSYMDFIHCMPYDMDSHDKLVDSGAVEDAPLIGYVTFDNRCQLNIYSLVKEATVTSLSLASPVRKFVTCP